ncbi:DUF2975 family protein [Halanaerobium saccharolyticum]|uniref:DUF2975 family protein n=1 Tax=Halanaerobium saccharolyticum TaxID=43595 RepID=A0A4R6LRN8_9FIRM|nr:DUF2975 domain-containing protein [Halanaerobium saccharolyticum]TDO91258.1 DUF2975 family protein [Halanaerobium saccharolyticum]
MKLKIIFLKAAVVFTGIIVSILLLFFLAAVFSDGGAGSTKMAYVLYGIATIMTLSLIPFIAVLYQMFKLLSYVDSENVFSNSAGESLIKIKKYAYIISIMYALMMPLVFIVAEVDDAPGAILYGMILVLAPLVIAFSADVLQKLLRK